MRKSRIAILFVLLGLSFYQPIRADEAAKRYWIDELAGPIGDLKGKGVELLKKIRELKIIQEDGRGGRDGRMTRWIRVYETQFPWMLLASTEEKWERKYKRAAIRSYGECIRSPFILAPILQRESGKCAIPFEMPFESTQLESISSFLLRLNEIAWSGKSDSSRSFYRCGMPYPFTLMSAPNDYNKLDVICSLQPWYAKGCCKDRHPDFQTEFHDAVKASLMACEKNSHLSRIHIPLSPKWKSVLGTDISRMRDRFGECKLLFTCAFDIIEQGITNGNVTFKTYSFNSNKGWVHTRQYHGGIESVYKIQVSRDLYQSGSDTSETDGEFTPVRTWGGVFDTCSGIQNLPSNICVMVDRNPFMFHWTDEAQVNLKAEVSNTYHCVSWMVQQPTWFPSTFSTNVADMCQLYYLESLPQEMFRVPHACYEPDVKGGGVYPK